MMWLMNLGFGATEVTPPVLEPCDVDISTAIVDDTTDTLTTLSATETDVLTALFPTFDISTAIVFDTTDIETEIDDTPTDILTDLC